MKSAQFAISTSVLDLRSSLCKRLCLVMLLAMFSLLITACATRSQNADHPSKLSSTIRPLKNRAALNLLLEKIHADNGSKAMSEQLGISKAMDGEQALESIAVTGSRISGESKSITNNQVQGIDEGDIIKRSGNLLVNLHDGMLSVTDIGDTSGALQLRDSLDLHALSQQGDDVYYDELLVHGSNVIVLGYAYTTEATQIDFIALAADGSLRHIKRYWLSSGDYYDASNYGARIVGDELMLVLSHPLTTQANDWPMLRRQIDQPAQALTRVEDLYLPTIPVTEPVAHWVIRCKLSIAPDSAPNTATDPIQACRGRGIVGTSSKQHYISDSATYFACADLDPGADSDQQYSKHIIYWNQPFQRTVVFRIPHDNNATVSGAFFKGTISNQFQLHEFDASFYLLASDDRPSNELSDPQRWILQAVPIANFSIRPNSADYTKARIETKNSEDPVRFSGPWLWLANNAEQPQLIKHALQNGARYFVTPHGWINRIEPTAKGIVAIGATQKSDDLFVSLLPSNALQFANAVELPDLFIDDDRSHAFNAGLRADGELWFGFPVSNGNGDSQLQFLRWDTSRLTNLALMSMPNLPHTDTDFDWYGNARVFFIGDRIFGSSGLRLSEFELVGNIVRERSTVYLTPSNTH